MDHLSSCYFCGAALDEPLGAYTIEPSDGAQSVTLCASCRHKLDRLLDATGIGETVPAEASSDEAGAGDTDDEPEAPEVGNKEPTELLEGESSEGPPQVDEELSAEVDEESDAVDEDADTQELDDQADAATAASEAEPADEWDPDPEEWDEPAEGTTTPADREGDLSPEPITTNPEELPDDEEVTEVPGIAADADESAAGGWETDIQDEMQPNVPDEFAESETETDQSSAAAADSEADQPEATDAERESEPEESGALDDEPTADPAADDEPILTDAEGPADDDLEPDISLEGEPEPATGDEDEDTERGTQADSDEESEPEPVGDDEPPSMPDESGGDDAQVEPSDRSEDPTADEGDIDPSILQADEIATGDADIEEVLDGEIEIPDELAASDADEAASGDDDHSDQPPAEPETNGEEAVDPDAMDTEDPFDLDTDTDDPGTTESIERDYEAPDHADESDDSEDDGGFDFENDPGTPPDDEDDLQSEMEADIPEELRPDSGTSSEEPAAEVKDDLEAIDAMSTGSDHDETAEPDAQDEEITFDDDDAEEAESDESAPGAPGLSESVGDTHTEDDSPSEPSSAGSGVDEPAPTESEASDPTPTESGVDEPAPTESEASDPTPTESDDTDKQHRSISALEYNKVMRLLQNREFPVDRTELMAVAASTYDLSEADCAEVLNIAIDRGLLAEDGNKLVKPD